jgi:uncharacterized membrane protein
MSGDVETGVDASTPPAQDQERAPARVFALRFSGPGLAVAVLFFALSLAPSLLPRAATVQGLVSGITMMIGYGLGAGGQALWNYLEVPLPPAGARKIVTRTLLGIVGLIAILSVWQWVGWQNDVRAIFGSDPLSISAWMVTSVVTLLLAILILIVARSLRRLVSAIAGLLSRLVSPRFATLVGGVAVFVLVWTLVTGVAVNAFFGGANSIFSTRDTVTPDDVTQPEAAERSGSSASIVSWDSLGREGRVFMGRGPTAADIDAFSGGGAKEPIRAFVGLKSAETLEDRAELLLAELKRTGAFDRQVLVVATTTGSGFVDPNAIEPFEYLFNGDTAVGAVQYSYLPSWISLLADQTAVQETSRVVFDTVHSYWSTLPEATRPKLYLYGLSLGSFGVEAVLSSINVINEPIDGAFMAGPPFVNKLHRSIEDNRQAGTPPWQPIYQNGRTVRFRAEQPAPQEPDGAWGPTRLVYLQHASDPVVFFSPNLLFNSPAWLEPGELGPDVYPEMTWAPIVTMWQVAADLPAAGAVPDGFGHNYSRQANLESWVAMTQPSGWTDERTNALVALLDAKAEAAE